MTATLVEPSRVQTAQEPGGIVLLRHISWDLYETLLEEVGDEPVHLTYDDGFLEIEVPSDLHERLTELVGAMAETVMTAADVEFQPVGSRTWKRMAPLKGIQADKCYYIASVSLIRDRVESDKTTDPPPDLAIETEVAAPLLDKLKIYAALGVPEVWRVNASGDVRLLRLNQQGAYEPMPRSLALPQLDSHVLTTYARLLKPLGSLLHSEVLRQFRKWLQSQ
jgi:Uma2 family endonuclease